MEPAAAAVLTDEEVGHLLDRTSRTFAISIPLLNEPLRRQVGLAYLLFRIADTLEDAPRWTRSERLEALATFTRWLDGDDAVTFDGPSATDDQGYVELLSRANDVMASTKALADASATTTILTHTKRTAEGMSRFVARQDESGAIVLADLPDLEAYAYVVAGIVGELLTELFALTHPLPLSDLLIDARAFGEGLQLVNILKDAPADAKEGRSYLPASVPRIQVLELARTDLTRGARYIESLKTAGAPSDIIAFCTLPLKLAEATLDHDGSKISREDVARILATVTAPTP